MRHNTGKSGDVNGQTSEKPKYYKYVTLCALSSSTWSFTVHTSCYKKIHKGLPYVVHFTPALYHRNYLCVP